MAAKQSFSDSSAKIKGLETKMPQNAALQKHIVNYSKTRNVYTAYRKAGYSKQFRTAHEGDILLHQSAKKAFDELSGKKIPTVAAMRKEHAELLAQKKEIYAVYKSAKSDMQELTTAKANIDRVINAGDDLQEIKKKEHGR